MTIRDDMQLALLSMASAVLPGHDPILLSPGAWKRAEEHAKRKGQTVQDWLRERWGEAMVMRVSHCEEDEPCDS